MPPHDNSAVGQDLDGPIGVEPGVDHFVHALPDGGAIAYSDESWLYKVSPDGTHRVRLTEIPPDQFRDLMPDWGPGPSD